MASHIVKYGELPKMGPFNLLYEAGIKNSPVYFYILALPLLFYNHPLTLGIFNIFLQVWVLLLIFLIAKQAFGNLTALMALTLFSFNPEVIKQSDYIWQPYLMHPFALLALYFLVRAYHKNSYKLLIFSLSSVSFAFLLHNSAFPWLIALVLGSLLILKARNMALVIFTLIVIVLYLPLIGHLGAVSSLPAQSIKGYIFNLNLNFGVFLNTFYVNKLFLVPLLILSAILYRRNLFFILLLFLLPFLFASLFHKIRFHYLILSSGVFAILVAYFLERIKFVVPKLALLALLVWVFSGHFQFLRDFKRPLENLKVMDQISEKIVSELPNPQTFQVKSYAKDKYTFYYPVLDTILLVPLEEKLKVKLAEVSDESPYNHVQINEKDYIVLACYKFQSKDSDCREDFLKDNESYEFKKTIHTSEFISVYLAKQKAY